MTYQDDVDTRPLSARAAAKKAKEAHRKSVAGVERPRSSDVALSVFTLAEEDIVTVFGVVPSTECTQRLRQWLGRVYDLGVQSTQVERGKLIDQLVSLQGDIDKLNTQRLELEKEIARLSRKGAR